MAWPPAFRGILAKHGAKPFHGASRDLLGPRMLAVFSISPVLLHRALAHLYARPRQKSTIYRNFRDPEDHGPVIR